MAHRKRFLGLAACGFMLAAVMTFGTLFAATGQTAHASATFAPRFYSFHHQPVANAARPHTPAALATWTETFQYNGVTYPYSMVGTDPYQGSKTTTIPVTIVPLNVVFGKTTFNGQQQADKVQDSPLFRKADFQTGHTQYTDAIQRGSFWSIIQKYSPNYHVLVKSHIAKPYTINVNSTQGSVVQYKSAPGHSYGNINDINWWDAQMQTLLTHYHSTSNGFTIFLSYDVVIMNGIGGYHSATGNGLPGDLSYAWASYYDPFLYAGFANTGALSHEMAEWMADPYTTNVVPSWNVPSQPQYGCTNSLEVGDPLVGVVFKSHGYTLQDEAYYSWFSRQDPSLGFQGYYSYLGTFRTFSNSTGCPAR